MNLESLIILNGVERPCARLVCRIYSNKTIKYVNKNFRKHYKNLRKSAGWATLKQFGFVKDGNKFVLKNKSKVKYSDGEIRHWQGINEFTYNDILNMERFDDKRG